MMKKNILVSQDGKAGRQQRLKFRLKHVVETSKRAGDCATLQTTITVLTFCYLVSICSMTEGHHLKAELLEERVSEPLEFLQAKSNGLVEAIAENVLKYMSTFALKRIRQCLPDLLWSLCPEDYNFL